jgi:hypothetical protein
MLDSTCVITKSRGSVDGIAGDVKQLFSATNAAVKSSNSVAISTHTHLLKLEAAITAQQHNQKVIRLNNLYRPMIMSHSTCL